MKQKITKCYQIFKRWDDMPAEINARDRDAVAAWSKGKNRELANRITERFADVEIVDVGMICLTIRISSDSKKTVVQRAQEVKKEFDCTLTVETLA